MQDIGDLVPRPASRAARSRAKIRQQLVRFRDRRLGFDLEELEALVMKAGLTDWRADTLRVKPDLHIVLGTAQKA